MTRASHSARDLAAHLRDSKFTQGNRARVEPMTLGNETFPRFINEFWTARQRQASTLQEISYRACFKPQLPRFFIERLTQPGDLVYDPFAGRGTSVIEAALLGRRVIGNDVNPLSQILTKPRLSVPNLSELTARLDSLPLEGSIKNEIDLSMFFHQQTLGEVASLREYLRARTERGEEDLLDSWIRMVATNRLTGHSAGFFSVYTFPPNQAVSVESQRKINAKRKQHPEYRNTRSIILKKSKQLVRGLTTSQIHKLARAAVSARFLTQDARGTPEIASNSVQLTVTSPPFLNVVQYAQDNWLRCWFNCIETEEIGRRITTAKTIEGWSSVMQEVFSELYRVTRGGGWVAFEVGEIRSRRLKLDEHVVPLGLKAGFRCEGILVNEQQFTKTANIWGVKNNLKGTNTNRVVIFQKN